MTGRVAAALIAALVVAFGVALTHAPQPTLPPTLIQER